LRCRNPADSRSGECRCSTAEGEKGPALKGGVEELHNDVAPLKWMATLIVSMTEWLAEGN
jgi:hypothetical protein